MLIWLYSCWWGTGRTSLWLQYTVQKTRNSNTNTYRITFKQQESEFSIQDAWSLRGDMEQSHNGSWPRPVLHLIPIYTCPSHLFSVWIWKCFLHAFSCTKRFTKSKIFYTLGGTQIPCTHPFLLLSIWDSKGARDGPLLPKTSERRVLRCPTQNVSCLNSLHTSPFQLPCLLPWYDVGLVLEDTSRVSPRKKKNPYLMIK